MKAFVVALCLVGLSTAPVLADGTDETEQRVAESRGTAMTFMKQLKGELQSAMKDGGPVNAIEVCHTRAPQISAQISQDKGWRVARTSLRVRNPGNAPDGWERSVLEQFEKRKADGEDPKQLEHHEVVDYKGKRAFRYMKAIPTGAVCLMCHGETIDPKVEAQLAKLYPEDQARGFREGDIRGAFTFIQPLE